MISVNLPASTFDQNGFVKLTPAMWAINRAMRRGISEPVPPILNALSKGDLISRDAKTLAPLSAFYAQSVGVVALSELQRWGKDTGLYDFIEPVTSESAATPKVGAGGAANHEWKKKARSIGESWMHAEERRTGKCPSGDSIAKHVADEFKRLDFRSKRLDDYYDWQTIKKEALTGITGRKQGDNFRKAKGNPQRKK
jgi:hypothetical protein